MSLQHCSLAYADEMEHEMEIFHDPANQNKPTLKRMNRSMVEITAMNDIVEFGGTITVSF